MHPFDSYMLNKVRRLKDVRKRYAWNEMDARQFATNAQD